MRALSRGLGVSGRVNLPGVGECSVVSEGWQRGPGVSLECRYQSDGSTVARLVVGLDPRDSRLLHAVNLEVLQAWRGKGVGITLLQRVCSAGAHHFDRIDAQCESLGNWAWLGVFDWDPNHRTANAKALHSTLLSSANRYLRFGTPVQRAEIAQFIAGINMGLSGSRAQPFRVGMDGSHIDFRPGTFATATDACLGIVDTITTQQIKDLARSSGPTARQLIIAGHDWHGLRKLP